MKTEENKIQKENIKFPIFVRQTVAVKMPEPIPGVRWCPSNIKGKLVAEHQSLYSNMVYNEYKNDIKINNQDEYDTYLKEEERVKKLLKGVDALHKKLDKEAIKAGKTIQETQELVKHKQTILKKLKNLNWTLILYTVGMIILVALFTVVCIIWAANMPPDYITVWIVFIVLVDIALIGIGLTIGEGTDIY